MKVNYKRLGEYILPVVGRNNDFQEIPLMGLSITKKFIPSIANIIGTDMSTYRTIYKNQFAYGPVTSRNGEKITIALFNDYEKALISQAYIPFEVEDTNKLLPEYLMMWFSRPEFDRYSRFMSHGSAREIFAWEDMCNIMLPIPTITKQKEIVKEYNVIQNRIKLNQQLIQKLEETAQAVYKQWFVDFEFPNEKGKQFKTNGGEMVWCEELGKEIPKGWENVSIKDYCIEMKSGGTPSRVNSDFWNKKDIPWLKTGEVCNRVLIEAEEYISNEGCQNSSAQKLPINTVLIAMYGEGKTKGQAGYLRFESTTNQACCAMICENEYYSTYLYYFLRINQSEIANLANGGAQPNLSKELIENISIIKPKRNDIEKHHFIQFINHSENLERENQKLNELKDLLLSKMASVEN
jgi:type I restriction enzyme S subunit